jgi:hypothetical protein
VKKINSVKNIFYFSFQKTIFSLIILDKDVRNLKKQQKPWNVHNTPFRIRLSQKELDVLLKVLFHETSYVRKNQHQGTMAFHWKRYYKASLSLIRLYSQPMTKERKMFEHTIENLDILLGMLEVHLYDTLKDKFSIKLYERLCRIYQKRQKEYLSIAEK